MLGPTLRGQLISLEPTRHDDLALYRSWFANMDITRYLLRRFVPSEKEEEQWYERVSTADDSVVWRIAVNDKTIGNTGIHSIDWINRHGDTGLMIGDSSEWGKGYASEAVKLRTSFAFNQLGLERLGSSSFTQNLGMHRALEKSGYQKIGCMRHYIFRDGGWHDLYVFELLREEWLSRDG